MATTTLPGGTFTMAEDLTVTRMGYGAMQLAGPHVFGPPADGDAAVAVLREAVELGITHIDTSDFYGPHVTNQIIKEALHPYRDELHIVTKVGALRDAEGGWPKALAPDQLRRAVQDNLSNLDLDALDVVNLRVGGLDSPEPGSIAEPFTVLAELQQEGLIKHLGLSTVSAEQIAEAQSIAPIVCVQNFYNASDGSPVQAFAAAILAQPNQQQQERPVAASRAWRKRREFGQRPVWTSRTPRWCLSPHRLGRAAWRFCCSSLARARLIVVRATALPPCDARLPRSRRHAVLSQVVHLGEPSAALIVAEC